MLSHQEKSCLFVFVLYHYLGDHNFRQCWYEKWKVSENERPLLTCSLRTNIRIKLTTFSTFTHTKSIVVHLGIDITVISQITLFIIAVSLGNQQKFDTTVSADICLKMQQNRIDFCVQNCPITDASVGRDVTLLFDLKHTRGESVYALNERKRGHMLALEKECSFLFGKFDLL